MTLFSVNARGLLGGKLNPTMNVRDIGTSSGSGVTFYGRGRVRQSKGQAGNGHRRKDALANSPVHGVGDLFVLI